MEARLTNFGQYLDSLGSVQVAQLKYVFKKTYTRQLANRLLSLANNGNNLELKNGLLMPQRVKPVKVFRL